MAEAQRSDAPLWDLAPPVPVLDEQTETPTAPSAAAVVQVRSAHATAGPAAGTPSATVDTSVTMILPHAED